HRIVNKLWSRFATDLPLTAAIMRLAVTTRGHDLNEPQPPPLLTNRRPRRPRSSLPSEPGGRVATSHRRARAGGPAHVGPCGWAEGLHHKYGLPATGRLDAQRQG